MQKIESDLNIFKLGLLELKEKRIWLKEFVLAELRSFPTAFLQPGHSQRALNEWVPGPELLI